MDELNVTPQNLSSGDSNSNNSAANTENQQSSFSLDSIGTTGQEKQNEVKAVTAQPVTKEEDTTPLSSLSSADSTNPGTPVVGSETVPATKKSPLKMALIIGGIVVVIVAAVVAIFFGKGWPFKGELTALTEQNLKFVAATLCPDDQYMPKASDAAALLKQAFLPSAKAQPLSPSKFNLSNIEKAVVTESLNTTANVNNTVVAEQTAATNTDATLTDLSANLQNTAVNETVNLSNQNLTNITANSDTAANTNDTTTVTEISPNATLDQAVNNLNLVKINNNNATAPSDQTVGTTTDTTVAPSAALNEAVSGMKLIEAIPQAPTETANSCKDIPHDNLVPGEVQCDFIDQLYADQTGYMLNDVTKQHLAEWYQICHSTPVSQECGTNQEFSQKENQCVCKEGYFDVSSEIPQSAKSNTVDTANYSRATATAVGSNTLFVAADVVPNTELAATNFNPETTLRLAPVDNTRSALRCTNCDELNRMIDDFQTRLSNTTDEATKTTLEERIKILIQIAENHGCRKPETKCPEGQILTSDGTCECPEYHALDPQTQKCTFDCQKIVNSIQGIKEKTTPTEEEKQLLDRLLGLAEQNQCDVPVEKTLCEQYEEDARTALEQKNYEGYLNARVKILNTPECSGEIPECQRILREATLVKEVTKLAEEAGQNTENYTQWLEDLKGKYYANEQCKDDNRCAEIEKSRNQTTPSVAPTTASVAPQEVVQLSAMTPDAVNLAVNTSKISGASRLNALLKPGTVFEDDNEYYQKNCQVPQLPCDTLLGRYQLQSNFTNEQLAMLDVSEEVRNDLMQCQTTTTQLSCDQLLGRYQLQSNFTNAQLAMLDVSEEVRNDLAQCQTPTLACAPSKSSVNIGNTVEWTATFENGAPEGAKYSWTGDATGSDPTVSAAYNSVGTKNVKVTATTPGGEEYTAMCRVDVTGISPVAPPDPKIVDPVPGPLPGPTPTPSPSPTPTPAPTPTPSPTPSPTPTPAPSPTPASSPTPSPSPISSPTPSPSTPVSLPITTPSPSAPAKAPTPAPAPVSSPTPSPSTPVSLPITTPSAPVVKTPTPAAPVEPVMHGSAPVVAEKPKTPDITPTGPESLIYLGGLFASQLYYFRRKVFKNKK